MATLTMTNHPIHMHGYEFKFHAPMVGGWILRPLGMKSRSTSRLGRCVPSTSWPTSPRLGDPLPQVAPHMNPMGHSVKTYIGVNKKDLAQRIKRIAPGYMPMGSNGMGEMGSMEMPLPANAADDDGLCPVWPVEMGGMFSVVKVCEAWPRTTTRILATTSIRRDGRLRV